MDAVVEEAHRLGYRTAAHAEGLAGTELAIDAGVDTIEHGMYLNQRPDLLERMAASGQVLVPTLSCLYGVAGLEDQIGLGETAHSALAGGPKPFIGPARRAAVCWAPPLVELARYNLAQADLTLRAARAAGVRIAAGHDWHPIWDHAIEIRRMIAHGLTAAEALAAATSEAAYALGLADRVGAIAPGLLADLVVIDGDPVADPSLLSRRECIWLVLQAGTPVAGAALERALPAAHRHCAHRP